MHRELAFHDKEAQDYLEWLVQFLGVDEIDHRLEQIDREIASSKGAFREDWVLPKCSFWIGLRAARVHAATGRSFAGAITPQMERPLEIAFKLKTLSGAMSKAKLESFRSRLLTADFLEPVFFEIEMGTHFWSLGYEIEWFDDPIGHRARAPEFIVRSSKHEFEVECKTQGSDLGRRITRPHFAKLMDALVGCPELTSMSGKILISVPGHLPASDKWKTNVVDAVLEGVRHHQKQISIADGTSITLALLGDHRMQILADDLENELRNLRTPFAHVAVHAHHDIHGGIWNPLFIQVTSRSEDQVLSGVLKDLIDANKQLTGQRAGLIACFIPEIESFEGLEKDSALVNMTSAFFEKHAGKYVYAVGYLTSAQRKQEGLVISTSNPAIIFKNPNYDSSFGSDIPLMI